MSVSSIKGIFAVKTSIKGYSIIELLTVMAILGIILTIAIPTYHEYKDKAYMSTIYAALRQTKLSQELYFTDTGRYFPDPDGEVIIEGPAVWKVPNADIKLYIPNLQIWSISSSGAADAEIKEYRVLIATSIDRDNNGVGDLFLYYKKVDSRGNIIEEADSYPLFPVVI